MSHEAVCLESKLLVPDATVRDVASACQRVLKEMGLRVDRTEMTKEGETTVFAREGLLVPLTLRTLLFPFSLQNYVKAAQRSGVHVVISPSNEGAVLYSCGLALDELTGKPAKFVSDEELEEFTNTMEALDFENKFVRKIREFFPRAKEAE